jgi:site-specific recombinase XerD
MRYLAHVFSRVCIADPNFPTFQRPVDTFDLINPRQASRLIDACYRDLKGHVSVTICLKAIDRYCRFLKECHTVYLPGHQSLYIPSLYGPIESPVTRYDLPRSHTEKSASLNYLSPSEYKEWLKYAWKRLDNSVNAEELYKRTQFYTLCVIAGETGIRCQELLGLQVQHLNLPDKVCLVVKGKGTNGSGFRKREVPLTGLCIVTLKDFLAQYPRNREDYLFQGKNGKPLCYRTANAWMREFMQAIRQAQLSILMEPGFGWHAFRRTFARLYLEKGGKVEELKRFGGWTWTSTLSCYIGSEKAPMKAPKIPLMPKQGISA